MREAIERDVAQSGRGGRNSGLGILLRAVQVRLFQGQLVGDVVPDQRRGAEFDGVIEGRESLGRPARDSSTRRPRLTCRSGRSGLSEAAFSSSGAARSYLCHSAYIWPRFACANLSRGLFSNCLLNAFDRLVVLALLPVDSAEIVVGELVVRIDFNLLLEGCDGLIVLAGLQINEAEIVPGKFVFGIDLGGALEKRFGQRQVAGIGSGARAFDEVVGLHVGRRDQRSGDFALDRKLLRKVGADRATEGSVIARPCDWQIVLMQDECASGGEDIALELVGRLIFGIVAFQRKRERRVGGVLRGEFKLDLVGVLALRVRASEARRRDRI